MSEEAQAAAGEGKGPPVARADARLDPAGVTQVEADGHHDDAVCVSGFGCGSLEGTGLIAVAAEIRTAWAPDWPSGPGLRERGEVARWGPISSRVQQRG